MRTLSSIEFDPQYEHPYDIALVCYLWLVARFDFVLGKVAARIVLTTPNTWWAWRYATQLLVPTSVRSHSKAQTSGVYTTASSPTIVVEPSALTEAEPAAPVGIGAQNSGSAMVYESAFEHVLTRTASSTQLEYAI